ncbi:MAG TPA: LysR family transcriptional regulator [Burkholderiales bacterium]
MHVNLRQLQFFVCLYEEGNVTRAAAKLHVVQPAVSMQICQLERCLGVKLFERNTRGVVPTAAGHAMYRIYQPILLDLQNAQQLMRELGGRLLGNIAVGVIPSVAHSILPGALSRFCERFPDVEVKIDEAYSGTLVEWVASGQLDFAVVNRTRRRKDIVVHPLTKEELVLVQRRVGAVQRTEPIRFAELARLKLVLPSQPHGLRMIVESAAAREDIEIRVPIEIDALTPTLTLVASSDFAAILPAVAAHTAAQQLPLTVRRIIEPSLARELVYVHREKRPLGLAASKFLGALVEEIARFVDMSPEKPEPDRRKPAPAPLRMT